MTYLFKRTTSTPPTRLPGNQLTLSAVTLIFSAFFLQAPLAAQTQI